MTTIDPSFIQTLTEKHKQTEKYPSTSAVCKLMTKLLLALFPEQTKKRIPEPDEIRLIFTQLEQDLISILHQMNDHLPQDAQTIASSFFNKIPTIYELLLSDIEAALQGDPAARSAYEVIRAYPGFYATAFYRLAHELYELNVPLIPRVITEYAHSKTGIDIHPGAQIDGYFFIDHGTGVVIGETSIIGKHVKIYQGVTLGALSVSKELSNTKRHPTIESNVVIYSGATILGGETVIGANSIIGGNVWITKSVPAHTTVYHQAQLKVN